MAHDAQAPATAEGLTQHTQNQVTGLKKLREPFPKEQVSALPKILCRNCSNDRNKVCPQHQKTKCKECGNYITTSHLHLDYVGHAELTNRLLEADLLWEWEPLALDERGLPQFDTQGGLWIRLTVCGHSRLGYGDSQGKQGPNAVKEAIGDALRNAAMRFGAALDLWAKSDLREAQTEHPNSAEEDVPARQEQPSSSDGALTPQQTQMLVLERFKPKVAKGWNNLDDTRQNLLEAKATALLNEVVPAGPDQVPTRIEDLLTARITELEKAKSEGKAA